MSDETSIADPAHAVATDAVLQAILDYLGNADPEARDKIAGLAKWRLDQIVTRDEREADFVARIKSAVKEITQRSV